MNDFQATVLIIYALGMFVTATLVKESVDHDLDKLVFVIFWPIFVTLRAVKMILEEVRR